MAIRICPLCIGKVPSGEVVALSNTMNCPHCQKPLEVSQPSRVISTLVGLAAAYAAFRFTSNTGALGWVLPMASAILTWGIVTPLLLMLTADLRVRAEQPYAEPISAPHGHGAQH